MDTLWRIELFGGLRLFHDSEAITHFRSRRAASLLAYLACHPGSDLSRVKLAGLIWPDYDESAGLASLRNELAALRKQLQKIDATISPLLADRQFIRLEPSVTTDIGLFEGALQRARQSYDDQARVGWLTTAVERFGGEILSGYYEAWIPPIQQRLNTLYLGALEALTDAYERAGDFNRAAESARLALAVDPYNEPIHRRLMQLYVQAGQPVAAIEQYRGLEQSLQQDLGVQPSSATRALAHEIFRIASGDVQPGVAAPAFMETVPSSLPGEPSPGVHERGPAVKTAPAPPVPGPVPGPEADLAEVIESLIAASESVRFPAAGAGPGDRENPVVTILALRFAEASVPSRPERSGLAARQIADVLVRYGAGLLPSANWARNDPSASKGLEARSSGSRDESRRHRPPTLTLVFGGRQVHEDDPERALLAALEVRDTAFSLGIEVWAGLHTGDWSEDDLDQPGAQAVHSSAIDRALSALSIARPGQLIVSPGTYDYTREAFDFDDLPDDGPPEFRLLTGRRDRLVRARGVSGLRAKLVGRELEMTRLRALYAEAVRGQGQIVAITGEAGVGKSRLISEVRRFVIQHAQARGQPPPYWLEGQSSELRQNVSYGLVIDLLRGQLSLRSDIDEATASGLLGAAIDRLVDAAGLSEPDASSMFTYLKTILSLSLSSEEQSLIASLSPDHFRFQLFSAVRDYLLYLSRLRPLVLVCEDLHWSDPHSLDLVLFLMDAFASSPVLILCAYRPDREHSRSWRLGVSAARKHPDRYSEFSLRELSAAESDQLVRALLAVDSIPPSLSARVTQQAQGNPFFIEEILRSLIEGDVLYREGEKWRVREPLRSTGISRSVQSVVLARAGQLEPAEREVLRIASVLGPTFRKRVLAQVAGPSTDVDRALWELEGHALVYQERAVPDEEYAFRHVLAQQAVYHTIASDRRRELHESVAETIEALYPDRIPDLVEELAQHYSLGDNRPKAVEYLTRAGEKAFSMGDHAGAEAEFRSALSRLPAIAPDREAISRWSLLSWRLADALHWQGRFDEAIVMAERALSEIGDTVSAESIGLHEIRMRSAWALQDSPTASRYKDRLIPMLAEIPYSPSTVSTYYGIAWVEMLLNNSNAAEQWLTRMEELSLEHRNEGGLARCYHGRGDLARAQGDLSAARRWFEKSLTHGEKTGDAHLLLETYMELAHAMILQESNLPEAEEQIQRGLSLADDMAREGQVASAPALCEAIGDAYWRMGDLDRALKYAVRAFDFGFSSMLHHSLRRLEHLFASQGRPDDFVAFCADRRHELGPGPVVQWRLEPGEPDPELGHLNLEDGFSDRSNWKMRGAGCLPADGILELTVSESSADPWIGSGAALALRPVSGHVAVEVSLVEIDESRCPVGGLILQAEGDYVTFGKIHAWLNEIGLGVFRNDHYQIVARGSLPGRDVQLRLERSGSRIRAFCRTPGERWFACGAVDLEWGSRLETGCYATGASAGATTSFRFKEFRVFDREGESPR